MAVYRVASEALTNTARHARASAVRLCGLVRDGTLTLEVVDDGRGAAAYARSSGLGLPSMRARVEELGGRLGIGRVAAGSGTRVAVTVPTTAWVLHA